jgi:hypothetical protein
MVVSLSAQPVAPADLPGTATLVLQASTGGPFFTALVFPCWFGTFTPRGGGLPQAGGSSSEVPVDTTGWTQVRVTADVAGAPVQISASVA